MAAHTLRQVRRDLRRRLLSSDRFLDVTLEVRLSTGERLYTVGGYLDTTAGKFVAPPAAYVFKPHVVRLEESQDGIGYAMRDYLRARLAGNDDRVAALMAIGNRGSGKTFVLSLFVVSLALALPGCWQIGVNINKAQRREVQQAIYQCTRPEWIGAEVDSPTDPHTIFLTGSGVLWRSSGNPAALRMAGIDFEHVFVNEGQAQPLAVYVNAIGAVRNTGGVMSTATNAPQAERGDWVPLLYDAIQGAALGSALEGRDGLAFILEASKNKSVNQAAVAKHGRLLKAVDKQAYEADALGLIKLTGEGAYKNFSALPYERGGHVGDPPKVGWTDMTRQITAAMKESGGIGYAYVGGADFQTTPGTCAAVGRIFRDERGKLVLCIEELVATAGTEAALSQALVMRGYFPGEHGPDGRAAKSLMLVGDATGARQNAEHSKRESNSFIQLRGDGWLVVPPTYHWRTGVAWWPPVRDSRAQMHQLFDDHQILISPRCADAQAGRDEEAGFPALIESFRRAKVTPSGSLVTKGNYQHGPDGVRYLAWRFLPRAQPPQPQGMSDETFNALAGIKLSRG